jgi:transposase
METRDDPFAAVKAELRESQKAMAQAEEIQLRRRRAVAAARDAGMTKYAIRAELGVSSSTVDSIVKAIERERSANAESVTATTDL